MADQTIAPRFERVWRAAETTTPTRIVRFNKFIVIASTLAVVVACLLAVWLWSKSTQPPTETMTKIVPQPIAAPAGSEQNKVASVTGPNRPHPKRQKHLARQSPNERTVVREAALLSSWQSPTKIFMSSPTTLVLNSLPQLNQSANELKQFLPRNNEVTKESNQ
ncbi:MAG TPA: hypothetical protein VJ875_08665 [Pyrinomonadaceae bacterium]|nr:hypothetical protein [Pyrinomonadaceae bacterium]